MEQGQRTGVGAASSARGKVEGPSKSSAEGASETLAQAKDAAQRAGRQAGDAAASLAKTANEEAMKLGDRQLDAGADLTASVAASVRAAAERLEQDIPQLSRLAMGAAEQIDDFAESIRGSSTREIMDRVSALARERPAIVLGAAAASGFVLYRLLRTPHDGENGRERDRGRGKNYAGSSVPAREPGGDLPGGSAMRGERTHGDV